MKIKKLYRTVFVLLLTFAFISCDTNDANDPDPPEPPPMTDATIFMESTIELNESSGDITLPIFEGEHDGETVWYIITESSDQENAEALGVNFSPRLTNALGTAAVQEAQLIDEDQMSFDFEGTVDFSPERIVVPGPNGFPPDEFQAGAVGDAEYSPLVTTGNGTVLNASQVANDSGMHDAIVDIDFENREVTLDQFSGFYEFEEVFYLHQEGSIELVAAVEGSTWAPNLNEAPGLGSNSIENSARAAILPIVNGISDENDANRQGLQSALLGQGDPLNVTQEEPTINDAGEFPYTPVWDLHLIVWTDDAIAAGERRVLMDHDEVADAFTEGLVVSGTPNSGMANSSLSGLEALGAISNCPMTANLGPAEE